MTLEEEKKDIRENRELAAFSYFLILSPVLLYTKSESPFIQFHARQAVILFIIAIVLVFLGKPFSYGNLLVLATCITGIIQANQENKWRIPIVANIIETGVNPDSVWRSMAHYINVFKSVFTKKKPKPHSLLLTPSETQKVSTTDIKKIAEIVQNQEKKIRVLEEEIKLLKSGRNLVSLD